MVNVYLRIYTDYRYNLKKFNYGKFERMINQGLNEYLDIYSTSFQY